MERIRWQGDAKIAFSDSGTGSKMPLVLLHGFCETSSIWHDFAPKLGRKRLILIDLPGFGESDLLPGKPEISQSAEAVAAVLDYLKIKKSVVVGHSMGGYIALELARKQPHALAGIGLFHSHPFEDSAERKDFRRKSIEFIRENGHTAFCRQLFGGLFAAGFLEKKPEILAKLMKNAQNLSPEGIISAIEAMISRPDCTVILQKLTCPFLAIIGEKDPLLPTEMLLRQTHLAPVTAASFLKKIGHMGMLESPEKTAKIISNFYDFCKKWSKTD